MQFSNFTNYHKKRFFPSAIEKNALFNVILIYFNNAMFPRKKKTTNFAPICERVYFKFKT